jgi:predicted amidohydrolase YtcJ
MAGRKMSSVRIAGARLGTHDAEPVDVRIRAGRIVEIEPRLAASMDERQIDAAGAALLPGLNDHHVHLMATAAAQQSIQCGPPEVDDEAQLVAALRAAAAKPPRADATSNWLRGVGYHERVAGLLDRSRLDAWVPDRPLRIQHRSGALWMLNSRGLEAIQAAGAPAGSGLPERAERDARGRVNGRLFRLDDWLRGRLGPPAPLDLATVGRRFASAGVTGLCDATPSNGEAESDHFAHAAEHGDLPQHLRLMGGAGLAVSRHPRITHAEFKIILDENRLPEPDALIEQLRGVHTGGRAVAIHCVTRTEMVLALHALRVAGVDPGDRIEHASVSPPDAIEELAALGVRVVTQPGFVFERGDSYLRDVEARELPWLYRCRAFLDAGIPLAAGTDAPYGDPDPWRVMRAAVERATRAGHTLGDAEAIQPAAALGLFTSPLEVPGQPHPGIAVGQPGDLCLLDCPPSRALADLDVKHVAATLVAGRVVHEA